MKRLLAHAVAHFQQVKLNADKLLGERHIRVPLTTRAAARRAYTTAAPQPKGNHVDSKC